MNKNKFGSDLKIDQKALLEILQDAYHRGETALINSPKELIQEMALRIQTEQNK